MADGNILSDFGINILEEEIDDVIFQTNEFLTDATFTGSRGLVLVDTTNVHGTGCPVRYCDGSGNGVQDDGET